MSRERLGRLGGVELAGFVTGPVIGGVLDRSAGHPLAVRRLQHRRAARGGGPPGRRLPEPTRTTSSERLAFDLLRIPRTRVGLLLSIGLYLPVGVYDALWDRYLTDRGASNTMIGLSFLMYGIPFALLSAAGGRAADRIGATRAALIGILCAAPFTAVVRAAAPRC